MMNIYSKIAKNTIDNKYILKCLYFIYSTSISISFDKVLLFIKSKDNLTL